MFIKNFFKKLGLDSDDNVYVEPFETEDKNSKGTKFSPPASVEKELEFSRIIHIGDIVAFGEKMDIYSCIMRDTLYATFVKLVWKDNDIYERDFSQAIVLPNSYLELRGSKIFNEVKAIVNSSGLFKDIFYMNYVARNYAHMYMHNSDIHIKYLNDITYERFIMNCDDDISEDKLDLLKRQYLKSVGIDSKVLDRLEEFRIKVAPFPKFN